MPRRKLLDAAKDGARRGDVLEGQVLVQGNDVDASLDDGVSEVGGYIVDVSDADAVADTAAAVLDEVDRIDVVVNNAGVVRGNQYFWETDLERDAKFTIDVNTLAPMYVAHAFLPAMIDAEGDCRLLNLASAAGFTPNPRMAAYAASKWAVIGWSDSVRLELKQAGFDHVKVTTVCPYYTRTGMFEGAKPPKTTTMLSPEKIAAKVVDAVERRKVWVLEPWIVKITPFLKHGLPTGVSDFFLPVIGPRCLSSSTSFFMLPDMSMT